MVSVYAKDIHKGNVLNIDGGLWVVVEWDLNAPGNWRAMYQAKLKNLKTGSHIQKRYRTADSLDLAFLDKRPCEYLYQEGESYVFMDCETYEQFHLHEDVVGEYMPYIKHNEQASVTFYEGTAIGVDLPSSVTMLVKETEPAARGDTATSVTKAAVLETGLEIKVPAHISVGDRVRVDTRSGEFLGRDNQ
ncbi:MAG: elongation factor P [Planctomycetes bacterium]|nr:elongation factor P [Planctomycetota bacterium]